MKEEQKTISLTDLTGDKGPLDFIGTSTPRYWSMHKLFTPYKVKRGRTGSALTISDCVTIGVLHSLFQAGLKYRDLKVGGKFNIVFEMPGPGRWDRESKFQNDPRGIQAYLEEFSFMAYVMYLRDLSAPNEPGDIITFFTPDRLLEHVAAIAEPLGGARGRFFLNCTEWFQIVAPLFEK